MPRVYLAFAGVWAVAESRARDLQFVLGRPVLASLLSIVSLVFRSLGHRQLAVSTLLSASRQSDSRRFRRLLRSQRDVIQREVALSLERVTRPAIPDGRCIVLAEPKVDGLKVARKGVLLVSFSETSAQLFQAVDREKLAKLFHLVLEPSWAGYADPSVLCWLAHPEPVLVQASEREDRELLIALGGNLRPVTYGAGDWIAAPESLPPCGNAPTYDALCVANYGWWKRTHAFVAAVGHVSRRMPDYRAALVVARHGKTNHASRRLRSLIEYYGVSDKIDLYEGLSSERLQQLYCCSRLLVFPSWKEGSSRVIYEALGHNVPVVVLKRNVGVNKEYITPHTGWLVDDRDLASHLERQKPVTFEGQPRAWFLQNLGPEKTTAKLVADLQSNFPDEDWKPADVAVKVNAPEARLYDPTAVRQPLSYWLRQPLD